MKSSGKVKEIVESSTFFEWIKEVGKKQEEKKEKKGRSGGQEDTSQDEGYKRELREREASNYLVPLLVWGLPALLPPQGGL